MEEAQILHRLTGIMVLAVFCQWVAWRVRVPAILFLLSAGIVIGPLTNWVNSWELYGSLLFPMINMSVAIVLFEGSMGLKIASLKGIESVVWRMISVGMISTWLITALAAQLLFDVGWELAMLFGSIMVVTGPTVILPMLRSIRPTVRIAEILRWEGILIDPIGAILAVLVFEFIMSHQSYYYIDNILKSFIFKMAVGVLCGVLSGEILTNIINRHRAPEELHNFITLALVLGAYTLADEMMAESGLITVTVMGIWLTNRKGLVIHHIHLFKETISTILVSVLFIVLAAHLYLWEIMELGWNALWLLLVLQLVARPIQIAICTWKTDLSRNERIFLSWVAPRGIIAAAIASLFAMRMEQQGFPRAGLLVPMTFSIIIGTVFLQSLTSRTLARRLGVQEQEPRGVLVIGTNPVSRFVAKSLQQAGLRIMMVDDNQRDVIQTRQEGLPIVFGNPFSDQTKDYLNLTGVNTILAMSRIAEKNWLSVMHFEKTFGAHNIFLLQSNQDKQGTPLAHGSFQQVMAPFQLLFGDEVSYESLLRHIEQGDQVFLVAIPATMDFEEIHKGNHWLPLFLMDEEKRLYPLTTVQEHTPKAGWTLFYLASEPIQWPKSAKVKTPQPKANG